MNVIAHQAVGQNRYIVALAVFFQPPEIGFAILIGKKDVLAPIATLGNVVRNIREYGSGKTGHASRLALNKW